MITADLNPVLNPRLSVSSSHYKVRQTVLASFPALGWKGGTVKGLMHRHRPFIQAVKASSASSSAIKARAKAEME